VRLQRHELHTLTGSYALDAVQGEELAEFERHLSHCPSCPAEVRGLRETAARLALATAERPPAAMRGRVLALAERTRQLPPLTDERPARRGTSRQARRTRRVWIPRLSVAVAALSVAAAVLFGVGQSNTQDQLNSIRSQLASAEAHNHAIAAVLAASDARLVSSPTSQGGTVNAVVSPREGKLVVLTSGLPALPASKVYQLWLLGPSVARPSGLLSQQHNGRTEPVVAAGLVAGYKLGVTVEPAGGSLKPTTTPIVVMPLAA
jgi:anti-sigma-K factor RskA